MQNSMLNLACSSFVGRWWISAFGMWRLVPTLTFTTCSGRMSCSRMRSSISPMPGMGERARRVRLDRDAGEGEGPRVAELAVDRGGVVAAARRLEEAAAGFQHDRRRGPAELREFRRDDAALGGAARMERLGHGAEVLAQARRLARADAERAPRLLEVKSHHARGAGGGGDRADGGGGVEAVVVVARVDRLGRSWSRLRRRPGRRSARRARSGCRSRPAPAPAAAPARWGG